MNIRTDLIVTAGFAIGALAVFEAPLAAMPALGPPSLIAGQNHGEARPEQARIICYGYGRCYRTYGYRHYYYRRYGYRYYAYPHLRFGLGIF